MLDNGKFVRNPSSTYRAGFEIRTYRLCKRILIFHHFPDELQIPDYLVKSTDFIYGESPAASFITQIIQSSYFFKDNKYLKKSFPPLEFKYSNPSSKKNGALEDFSTLEFEFNPSSISDIIREIDNPNSLQIFLMVWMGLNING